MPQWDPSPTTTFPFGRAQAAAGIGLAEMFIPWHGPGWYLSPAVLVFGSCHYVFPLGQNQPRGAGLFHNPGLNPWIRLATGPPRDRLVGDQAHDFIAFDPGPSAQFRQLDHEPQRHNLAARHLNQLGGGFRSPTGRQQIIHDVSPGPG